MDNDLYPVTEYQLSQGRPLPQLIYLLRLYKWNGFPICLHSLQSTNSNFATHLHTQIAFKNITILDYELADFGHQL